jgi:hypothetical protein
MDVPPHQCYTIELQATQGYMLDSGADTTYFLGRTDGAKNVMENEIQNNEAKTKIKQHRNARTARKHFCFYIVKP